jgi:hypothetical protein
MFMKKFFIINSLILLLSDFCLAALINFGNTQSTVNVRDTSKLEVNTPGQWIIENGGVANQGFGVIEGQDIKFDHGVYTFFNSVSDVSAVLNPNRNMVQLEAVDINGTDGTMIANPGGLNGVRVDAIQGVNFLRGQPLFFGTDDILLRDESTILSVAIQNTLNTNVWLREGVLLLQDDLRLGDDSVIKDSGHVIFNKRRLSLGGKISVWNGDILWQSAQDMQMNSAVTLNGKWSFLGENQINGNGNVIDIANGGSIAVLGGSILRLAGVQIKGLGILGKIALAPDAVLILSDVVIEMESDYDVTSGKIMIEGNSSIITKDHLLTFKDSADGLTRGKLIVDRVSLTYDPASSIDNLNIRPMLIQDPEHKYIEVLGNAEIRAYRADPLTFHNYKFASALQRYSIVAPYRPFQIYPVTNPDTNELEYDVEINGNTNFLGFTKTNEKILIVSENVKAKTTNIHMRDLSPQHIKLETGSSIVFGDQTQVNIARNEVLDYPWVFENNTILRGGGNILELGPNGAIVLQGQNSQLLLDGIVIKGISAEKIRCLDNSSKIVLQDVKWIQDGDFTYNLGGLEILNDVYMIGGFTIDAVGDYFYLNFDYRSSQPLRINLNSTLWLTRDMYLTIAPIDDNTGILQLEGPSAALSMDQATLAATNPSGIDLQTGRLVLRDYNYFIGNIRIGNNVILDQPTGVTLEQQP